MNSVFFVFFLIIFNVSSLLKDRLSPEELRELTDMVAAKVKAEARVEAKAVVEAEVEKKTRAEVEKVKEEVQRSARAESEKTKLELGIKLWKTEQEFDQVKKELSELKKISPRSSAPRRRHLSLQDLRTDRDEISFIDDDKLRKFTKPEDIDDLLLILREMRNDRLCYKEDHTGLSNKEDHDRVILRSNVRNLRTFLKHNGVPEDLLD